MKKNNNGVYIPSIDGKDAIIHKNDGNGKGYTLNQKDGNPNLRRYKNVFDYSIDLIELRKSFKNCFGTKERFSFVIKGKEYSPWIINVTFKYSIKEFNRCSTTINKKTYTAFVKYGHKIQELSFNDCVARNQNGDVVGVICGKEVLTSENIKGFKTMVSYDERNDRTVTVYKEKTFKTLQSADDIRYELYENGFYVDGVHYVRFKRSSGSARVGKCLFIREELYPYMFEKCKCGIENAEEGNEIDLASFEAYIALTSSSIIDTIPIKPENFLIIDDCESEFEDEAVVTIIDENNRLKTYQDPKAKVCNSIFDGQSLIDKSLMGDYKDKGMLLLRNYYFKSCCFNSNIQQFFADNNITDVSQLNGFTLAKDIKDIKIITTPSSIKFYKFNKNKEDWFKYINAEFGIVKYEKDTHYFDGELVQTHYQLLNSLQFTKEEMANFLKPSFDYLDGLNTDKNVMRHHIKWTASEYNENSFKTKNDIIYTMLGYDVPFEDTKIYRDFLKETKKAFLNNLRDGHIYINGTYATLCGNPYEMLLHSIGKFDINNPYMQPETVHNIRYSDNEKLFGCRSPHVCSSNLLLTTNHRYEMIDKYMNPTRNIVYINAINENILERLSGADYDSDTMILSNNTQIIDVAKINYDIFKVPTSEVKGLKTKRYYTKAEMADLDIKTGKNLIGEIINLSQVLNSVMWDKLYDLKEDWEVRGSATEHFDKIKDIFYDICQLDVMSCIEIDKAKKEFAIDNKKELNELRKKYSEVLMDYDSIARPYFFKHLSDSKGFECGAKSYINYNTSMDYLAEIIDNKEKCKYNKHKIIPFSKMFEFDGFSTKKVKYDTVGNILKKCNEYKKIRNGIYADSSLNSEERKIVIDCVKNDFISSISRIKPNNDTIYKLITLLDSKEKEYTPIKTYLFQVIFFIGAKHIKEYLESIPKLKTTDTTYEFYGIKIVN